jgi:hypothetical protein
VGIALGFRIRALHRAGLARLTETPSPMKFLSTALKRPPNERAYLPLAAGSRAEDVRVPDIAKKPLDEIASSV